MYYTIGETAKKMNLTPSTLRYYDKEGLLPFVKRSDGGIRMFKEEDFEWLNLVECLKKTGMSIKDIKIFIDWCIEGDETIDKRLELIRRQRNKVLTQIAQMNETLSMLDYKCWYYETAKKAGSCTIHETLSEAEIPESIRRARKKIKGMDTKNQTEESPENL